MCSALQQYMDTIFTNVALLRLLTPKMKSASRFPPEKCSHLLLLLHICTTCIDLLAGFVQFDTSVYGWFNPDCWWVGRFSLPFESEHLPSPRIHLFHMNNSIIRHPSSQPFYITRSRGSQSEGYPIFTGIFFPPPRFFSRLSSRRLVCQGSKAASKQASKAGQQASKQAKKGASEQASKQASQPASKQGSQRANQASKPASQQASPASQPASKQASKGASQQTKQASERASEPASEQASKRASEQTNQPTNQASKQAFKGASKGASEQTIFLRGISVRTEVVTSFWLYTPISIYTYALYLLALMERKKGIL